MGRKHNIFVGAEERAPKDRKLTRDGALTIVLLKPRIPQNTGSIARLCAATGCRLDLIAPLFRIDDAKLKRAGLDYWPLLDVRQFDSFEAWTVANQGVTPWFIEVGGPHVYTDVAYAGGDAIVIGDEQDGIPPSLLEKFPERHVRLPQVNVRSLNQAMATGIVVYEALRQLKWGGE